VPGLLPSSLRANSLFLVCMLLLWTVGAPLQRGLGLWGLALSELLIFLALPIAFAAGLEQRPLREIFRVRMLSPAGFAKAALLGLTAWLTGQSLGILALFVVQRFGGKIPDLYSTLLKSPLWVALVVGALIPSICEEVAFRGYIQWGLGSAGARGAVLLTGLLFGLMHLSLIRLLPLAVLGILFSAAVQRSGSVLTGIVMHLVNNGTALLLAFWARSRLALPPEPVQIPPGALLLWLVGGLGAAAASISLLSSLGTPADEAPPGDHAVPSPASERMSPGTVLLPLVPALLLFAYWSRWEILRVFGGR
jgi:membrane protease YdiL (CAAX protease family)